MVLLNEMGSFGSDKCFAGQLNKHAFLTQLMLTHLILF